MTDEQRGNLIVLGIVLVSATIASLALYGLVTLARVVL